jgi:hypothetical protein
MQRNVRDRIGVAVAKLKCPKPAPWIWTTGSPSPVSLYQMRTPLILASGIAFTPVLSAIGWVVFWKDGTHQNTQTRRF